jgi:hypothetical protein
MAETNARIMDMVRREIDKNPSISSEQLYEMAKKSDNSIGGLSVRQFHARYPLQVKRAAANARKARRGGAAKKTGARRGRPPGKTGRKAGGRKAGRAGTAKKARRGRPPGSGRKGTAKRATTKRATAKRATAKRAAAKRGSTGTGRGPGRPRRTAAAAPAGPGRDAVRSLLLQFARDIAGAEGKADVVEVIGEVDSWVDRVVAATT